MLNDKVLECVCAEHYIQNLSIGQQSDVIDAIENVFERLKEVYPDDTISKLLSDVPE